MKRRLDDIARMIEGDLQGDGRFEVCRVSIDSRQAEPGTLFFALAGTRHDGHEFVGDVLARGGAAVVSQAVAAADGPLIVVKDVQSSLQRLAAKHLGELGLPVVAVTGSVGKTTTKDMIAACLSQEYRVLASEGNYNNELGLPLTLLKAGRQHQWVVVEMGMRGLGQISALAAIAPPQMAVITNVAPVHMELLGSLAGIASAKCEILDGLALVNGDDEVLLTEAKRHRAPMLTFGQGAKSDIRLAAICHTDQGMELTIDNAGDVGQVFVPMHSEQLALNVVAAAGVARRIGVSWEHIGAALHMFTPAGHRLRLLDGRQGIRVIDDCYNANPLSMRAALETMARLARGRKKIAVLGEMYELGDEAERAHAEVGARAAVNADILIAVGRMGLWTAEEARRQGMREEFVIWCKDNEDASRVLEKTLQGGEIVLVKGSRGCKMEEIVSCLVGDGITQ